MLDLMPHQAKAIEELDNGKILVGGVGTGKSRTAVGYYLAREAPRDIYVITTAKKRDSLDWQAEFAKVAIGRSEDSTVAGVLHVDSWNNLDKYVDVKNSFFIFDEQRLVGSGAWYRAFMVIARRNRWILLSATPGDTWLDYVAVFVANGYYKHRSDFKQQHCVYSYWGKYPKLEKYVNVSRLVRHRNSLVVEMPYLRSTVRNVTYVNCEYDREAMELCQKKRWNVYEQRPLKDVSELFRVSRRLVNSDISRLNSLMDLLKKHPRTIVFYNFNYELEMLRSFLSSIQESESVEPTSKVLSEDQSPTTSGKQHKASSETSLQIAEWNGHRHDPIPESDSWVYLVQFQAGSEGWNCVSTDTMVLYSQTYSYRNWEQAFGRIDRLNTPYVNLHYYVLFSDSWIDHAIKRALDKKENFNERNSGVTW